MITVAGHLGVLVAFGLGAVFFRRSFRLSWFLAGLALYVIDNALLTRGFFLLPKLPGAECNWAGKLMSLAGMLAIAALPAFLAPHGHHAGPSAWIVASVLGRRDRLLRGRGADLRWSGPLLRAVRD